MSKKNAVLLVVSAFPDKTKDEATALIACHNVYINGELCSDPHQMYPADSLVDIIFPKYVSRGGFKLERAFEKFNLDVNGLVMLDAGSSTGGFSDCLLKHGASYVHCVDVGWNLLDYKIRSDSRVIAHEKTNIMALEKSDLVPAADAAVADLSFRSINKASIHILNLTGLRWMVALIKPQFEVPKWQENFTGVIKDIGLLSDTLANVWDILDGDGVGVCDAVESPIHGHKGNTEFLALLRDKDMSVGLDRKQFLECCLEGTGVIK